MGGFLFVGLLNIVYLLVGRMIGFRFWRYSLGPVTIVREPEGIRFRKSPGFGAMDALTLPRGERNLRRAAIILNASIPISCLVFGFLITLGINLPHGRRDYAWIDTPAFQGFVLGSLFVTWASFFGSIWNQRPNQMPNPRARIAMLRRGGADAERYCALMAIQGAAFEGYRPRDWHPYWIARLTVLYDGSLDEIAGSLTAYHYAFDAGDVQGAGHILARVHATYEGYSSTFDDSIWQAVAFYQAWIHWDVTVARFYFQKVRWRRVNQRTRMCVEAAILLAEGKTEESRSQAMEGMRTPDHYSAAGLVRAESDRLSAIIAQAAGAISAVQMPGGVSV